MAHAPATNVWPEGAGACRSQSRPHASHNRAIRRRGPRQGSERRRTVATRCKIGRSGHPWPAPAIGERGRKRWQRTCPATARPRRLPSPRIRPRIITATASGCAQRFRDAGHRGGRRDYELLELVLFRAMPRRDVKPLAKSLIATFGSFAEAVSAPVERLRRDQRPGRGRDHRAQDRAGRRQPARARPGETRARCCRPGRTCSTIAAPPWRSPNKEQFRILFLDKRNAADRRRGAADRHRRPHAGLSARGGQARARTLGHRHHPGAQPSLRRPDAVARRHPDDAGDRRGRASRSASRCTTTSSSARTATRA